MEKVILAARSALAMLLAMVMFGCSKTASEPKPKEEVQAPTETVTLNLVDVSDQTVGSLYIDNMNGRARARIAMDSGYHIAGTNLKANITLTSADGTAVYARCTDVDGGTGKCSTFPITVLKDNSDALYQKIISTDGLVFNIMDRSNRVIARSAKYTVAINN